MTDPTRDTLTTRLERLERASHRSKRITLLVLVGVAAAALVGQAAPHRPAKSLEAEEFVLRDSRGQVRASLGTTQSPGATVLQIHAEHGKPRARITVSSDGTSSLEVLDAGERVRMLLGVKDNGSPRIWLGDDTRQTGRRAP